jgi:hypothetical protein
MLSLDAMVSVFNLLCSEGIITLGAESVLRDSAIVSHDFFTALSATLQQTKMWMDLQFSH